jgi:hypothetical protein
MLWPSSLPVNTSLEIGGESTYINLPIMPSGKIETPNFKEPRANPTLRGYEVLDAGNITGYAAISSIQNDPDTGEKFGLATNSGATKYPWGVERYEEEIEHRTYDNNPANTTVLGRYKITEELKDRTLDFEQNVEFSSDEENFYLSFHRWVSVDGQLHKKKVWYKIIPRDFQ